jgi:hypothetical protein
MNTQHPKKDNENETLSTDNFLAAIPNLARAVHGNGE